METQSSELIREIQEATKIQTIGGLPRVISNQIVPVIEVNPRVVKPTLIFSVATATSGVATLISANPKQDVYIKGITLAIIKDAACDMASGRVNISCSQNGSKDLIALPVLTLTAQSMATAQTFNPPIKIDRNTAVNINGTYAAGVMWRTATINYYVDDGSNA